MFKHNYALHSTFNFCCNLNVEYGGWICITVIYNQYFLFVSIF